MQPPEKPQMAPYFIDRHNYVKTFLHLLAQRDIIQFVGDTYSRYGTGKTTVLSTLYYQIEATLPDFKPLWLSLDHFSVYYQNPLLSEFLSPLVDAQTRDQYAPHIRAQNLIAYQELLVELAKSSLPHLVNFRDILEARSLATLWEFFGAPLDPNTSAADTWTLIMKDMKAGQIERKTVEAAINTTASRLTQEFLDYYNPSIRADQNAILFADDYCWISDQPLGDWVLNDLSGHMRNTWTIISRTTEQLVVREEARRVENLYLTNFTPEEVAAYLHKRLGVAQLPPMMVENIYHFSKGHPQTVSMVADLLQTSLNTQPDQPLHFPNWQEGEYEETIPELLQQLIEDTPQPWLREALWLGVIARRFDARLLYRVLMVNEDYEAALTAGLLHEEDLEDQPVENEEDEWEDAEEEEEEDGEHPLAGPIKERIFHAVTRYSFVEEHHDDQDFYYAFHNNMREAVNVYLKEHRSEEYVQLHQKLVDAYSEVLSGYEEQDPAERYVALYRYEDPAWQRTVSEWLYHVSQIRDRHEADLEFLNIYFTAFQWWDFYLPFPFCDHVLKQWGWTQGADADSPIYELVSHFHEIFPRGFAKDVKGDPRWDEIKTVIIQIADLFDLNADPEALSIKERALHIALFEVYIYSLRFAREPNYPEAERVYHESISIAQEDGDKFNQSYGLAYLADMLLEMGRYDEAFAEAEKVNELMDADDPFNMEQDYEVLTLSYRVMGDARLYQGQYAEVAAPYSRSAMCGYAQNYAMMRPPDPYTIKWYEDNVRLNARYLIEVAQAQNAFTPIEAICHDVHAVWESFWETKGCPVEAAEVPALLRAGDEARLRAYLAPPAPALEVTSMEVLQDEHNRVASLFGIEDLE